MATTSVTIGVPVSNLDTARRWYERLLGKAPDIEPVPGIVEFEVAGTWIQLYESEVTGGSWALRIGVDNLDAERKRLEGLGIELSETKVVPGVISVFEFRDPDGNKLSCYQVSADFSS